jgi:hypothetical protein
MIQRSQSVYLLLVTVLMSFLLIRPYAEIKLAEGQSLAFHAHVIKMDTGNDISSVYKTTIPVIALVLITSLISFVNIFLYNRRIVQIRICVINSVLLIILLLIMFTYYSSVRGGSLAVIHYTLRIPMIFPFMSVIFNLMAYRAIQHDELLVNSYKRMR